MLVALHYCMRHEEEIALEKMRLGVRAFNEARGVVNSDSSGYHETVTKFWIELIKSFVGDHSKNNEEEIAERLVEQFGGKKNIYASYYSFDVINSVEARKRWIAPDLRALD